MNWIRVIRFILPAAENIIHSALTNGATMAVYTYRRGGHEAVQNI